MIRPTLTSAQSPMTAIGSMREVPRSVSAGDPALAKPVAAEADVIVSAIGPSRTGGDRREYLTEVRTLVQTPGDARLLVVGGAGSLLAGGKRLIDDPGFPEIYLAEARIGAESLEYLRGLGEGPEWTYISPAPVIAPGERTGAYKLAADSRPASRSPPRTTRSPCSTRSRTPGTAASGSP